MFNTDNIVEKINDMNGELELRYIYCSTKNVLSKTKHRKGGAGYRQGTDRVPNYALLHQTGPVCMPAAPGRCPGGTRAAF